MDDQSDPLTQECSAPGDQMICPNCLTANAEQAHFCIQCAAPLSAHAAIDPLGQVYAAGYIYQKAAGKPTRFIMVLGMWLIFAPQIPYIIVALSMLVMRVFAPTRHLVDESLLTTLLKCALAVGLLALYIAILTKVTRNYRRYKRQAAGLCLQCAYDLRGNLGASTCPECGLAIDWPETDAAE